MFLIVKSLLFTKRSYVSDGLGYLTNTPCAMSHRNEVLINLPKRSKEGASVSTSPVYML